MTDFQEHVILQSVSEYTSIQFCKTPFLANDLTSFSFFLFSASHFLFSTSCMLNTQALGPSYWVPVLWARCFFHVLAAKSSLLVQFKTIQSAIANLAALKVFFRRVSLGESRVWWQNKEINSSSSETCSIFSGVDGIWPEKKRVQIGVLALAKIPLFVWLADILSKTEKGLYGINPVACYTDCIFWVVFKW